MSEPTGQIIKGKLHGSGLLLSVFLLLSAGICLADETTPATGAETAHYPPDEIGEPDDGRMKEKPRIEDLGEGKYRIGAIRIDKAQHLISVPGIMLPYEDGKAIEFMATTKQGYKSYESVLMLEANAFEFNLACILIGLDPKRAVLPAYHFDPQPVQGDALSIRVGWNKHGQWVEHDVVELLRIGKSKPVIPSGWSYTGSVFTEDNRYLAQMDGVLIGLVHDPASIIEHREGLGLGNWGSINIDAGLAPTGGQEVNVKLQRVE